MSKLISILIPNVKLAASAGALTAAILFAFTPVASAQQIPQAPLSPAAGPSQSYNWAGYIADTSSYTGVGGSWIIPTIPPENNLDADATWVGIGGVKSQDLIQTGTQAVVQNGSVQYTAWMEMLPGTSTPLPVTVGAGDSVTASIENQGGNLWQVNFTDNTRNENYTTTVTYASSLSSADWIEEMPSSNFGLLPLDSFGTVSFSNAWTTANGSTLDLSSSQASPMNMVTASGAVLAEPSALVTSNTFTVTRTSAQAQAAANFGFGRTGRTRVGSGVSGYQTGRGQHRQFTQPTQTSSSNFQRRYVFRFNF